MFLICVSILLSFVAFLWWYTNYSLNYWERKKVPFAKFDTWTYLKSRFHDPVPLIEQCKQKYEIMAGFGFGGCFERLKPQLMVRDPDLIQEILLTHFDNFRDRGSVLFDEREPITNHLFSAPGNLWKKLRIRLTPTFTSGKIKYMFGLVKECAEELQEVLSKHSQTGEPFDAKDYSVNFTIEVISSTAFGIKTHSITADSEFKEMSRRIFLPTWTRAFKFVIEDLCPVSKNFFYLSAHDKKITDFFFKTVRETVAYRKLNQHSRNDFLQILMSLSEKSDTHHTASVDKERNQVELEFTNELMTAQCFLFFVAGFDTSSFILSTTLLELAVNSDVQDKLHEEIDHYLEENAGAITYEMIQAMPYLHEVVQESMRKYPVLPFLSRVSAKTYQIPGSTLTIDSGTEVIIPTIGLHYDPEYFPDPDKFDPERFAEEKIRERHNFVYLPFGGGPRNCIGSRFALVSVKLGVVHLLQKYHFDTTSETVYPLKYKPYKRLSDSAHKILLKCSLKRCS